MSNSRTVSYVGCPKHGLVGRKSFRSKIFPRIVRPPPLTGVAASPGVVTGRARVVFDPVTTELDEGDILVCETTDPSWVALFMVAGAVVTDYGGLLSHGPIVARELGIPCVCGTEIGSRRIRDGQLIRVDGDAGAGGDRGAGRESPGLVLSLLGGWPKARPCR